MDKQELENILTFLRHAEQLKNTYRSSHTSTGRKESVAEHTWRLCLMALVLERHFPQVDMPRVDKNIAKVPKPDNDPFQGADKGLIEIW